MKSMNLVLTYFDIMGAAEKVRLAFTIGKIPFTDVRVKFADWPALKPTTPYGQLPILSIDDKEPIAQSDAMLRYAGKLATDNGVPLYPSEDLLAIEEAIGFVGDIQKAWSYPLYMGMSPAKFGYDPKADNSEVVKKVRTAFVENDLPHWMSLLEKKLDGKKFLCGENVTIADCVLFPLLKHMTSGVVDHVPPSCLDQHKGVQEYMKRFMDIPEVCAWYAK